MKMILLQILLGFLFCDNFTHIRAQLNKCITPEGNEGFCMNIWECSSRTKYIFSDAQNSVQTYNTLKSVCDYTNSTIKLCCTVSNTGEGSISQEQNNVENLKNETNCIDESNNINNTEEPIAKAFNNPSDNLKLNKPETNIEPSSSQNREPQIEVIPINFGKTHENSAIENNMNNEKLELTETPDVDCDTTLTETSENKGNLLNDNNLELFRSANNNNDLYRNQNIENQSIENPNPENQNMKNQNIEQKNLENPNINNQNIENQNIENQNLESKNIENQNIENQNSPKEMEDCDLPVDLDDIAKKNRSVEFSTNSGNQISNNTFIIINMNDRASILNNYHNSTVSNSDEDENGNMINSSSNNSDKISMELFKKILCVIFGKNYNLAAFPQDNSDKNVENNVDTNIDIDEASVELASEASNSSENNSLEFHNYEKHTDYMYSPESSSSEKQTVNIYSPESMSYEEQVENINSSENDILPESIKNTHISEEKKSEHQVENLSEPGTDFSLLLSAESDESDESDEVFEYVSLPNPPHCGRNKKQISRKGEYSWQVLLKEKNNKSTKDFCKGTLITRQHIVTTAYCIRNRDIESVLIRSESISAYITLKIQDIRVHERFEPNRIQNDIALIKLYQPIALDEISPICLKLDSMLTKNLTGIIGYSSGYLKSNSEPSPKAMKLISHYKCFNELDDVENFLDIDENVLCAKSKSGTENVCLGNEGSPLVIRGKSNGQIIYYQIGMVSEVNRCDRNSRLGIFVNIHIYLNWLLKNM